jgi:hypothetical protein
MVCGEGNEDRPIVFLNVGKTASVVILRLHKSQRPFGPHDRVGDPVPHNPGPTQSRSRTDSAQLPCQKLIHHLRIGLSFGGFHDLADEESGNCLFAGAVLLDLFGIGGNDFVDDLFQG